MCGAECRPTKRMKWAGPRCSQEVSSKALHLKYIAAFFQRRLHAGKHDRVCLHSRRRNRKTAFCDPKQEAQRSARLQSCR
jgi:hypothetical protein